MTVQMWPLGNDGDVIDSEHDLFPYDIPTEYALFSAIMEHFLAKGFV